MASQVVSSRSVEMLSTESFIRGYHAYMDTWTPVEAEVLRLIPEPTNSVDRNAVAVMKRQIVGHVPFNLSPIVSLFLRRDVNKAFARVTGGKFNRGAGYGLEIPCVYEFYGPKPYIDKLREVIDSLNEYIWTGLISVERLGLQVVIVYVVMPKNVTVHA